MSDSRKYIVVRHDRGDVAAVDSVSQEAWALADGGEAHVIEQRRYRYYYEGEWRWILDPSAPSLP